jgi:hypothetical protein
MTTTDSRDHLSGPAAYEEGLWWLGQASEAARDGMRLEGDPEEPGALTQAQAFAAVARAYFTAAHTAAVAAAQETRGVYREAEREDWRVVMGNA